ncbi:hypothetical protein BN3590_00763 [Clostridium sp. C105KSO15]|nr:hypothetical protein BN3590_00763 [Clostridium sp. C105KSO15]
MLITKAIFEEKLPAFNPQICVIDVIEVMDEAEFEKFSESLLIDRAFIADRKDEMHMDSIGQIHALLVLDDNSGDGILIDCSGYDYPRYSAFMPNIKSYVDQEISMLADKIIKDGTQNTSNGTWVIYFDEIEDQYGVRVTANNGIGTMLFGILEARPEMAEVEPMEDGYDMTFYLDYCPNLDEKEKLSSGIPDDVFRLKDLIRVPIEDFHLVHHEVDMEPTTIVYLSSDTLTDAGKQEWGDVLNAQVVRVFHGIYGIQAECAGVDPQRLADFSLMLAGDCPNEDYETWVRPEPDEPGMTLKL